MRRWPEKYARGGKAGRGGERARERVSQHVRGTSLVPAACWTLSQPPSLEGRWGVERGLWNAQVPLASQPPAWRVPKGAAHTGDDDRWEIKEPLCRQPG